MLSFISLSICALTTQENILDASTWSFRQYHGILIALLFFPKGENAYL